MAGIYIHIPLCKKKCHYCDFYSVTDLKYTDALVNSLIKEMGLRRDYLSGERGR
ncbi:MAG: hypothetical protein HY738_16240 [Bacteroidia bacterium]|nr:hypothetical protein [Bacteroidia bacterium]